MPERITRRYKYSPLQDDLSVRLVTLLPGSPESPLQCRIDEVPDFQATSFEALSYAWGSDDLSESIYVLDQDTEPTDQTFPITKNLYEALQRLRTDTPRTLWIDAVCINQDDLNERGSQVARMGHVYRNTSCVIVWLGEDERYPRTRALLTQDGKNRWPLTLPEVDLGELLTISWFTRVWPVLEYVLPQSVFFQLGPLSIPSQHLETVVTRTGTYIEREKELEDKLKSIQLLFKYRKLVQERKPNQKDARLTLVRTFLDLTRSRLCKDSRDRIYGILGVFNDVNINPDYTLPARQVYQDFVSKHLVAGDFAILHECCIGIPNADEQSYVPFFGQSRSPSKYVPFADPLGATYSAGLHLPPFVNRDSSKYISIQGYTIDTVQFKLDFTSDASIDFDPLATTTDPKTLPLQGTWGAIYTTILSHLITDPTEQLRWRKDWDENRLNPEFSHAPYPHNALFDVLVRTIRTDINADFDWLSSKGTIRTDSHLRRARREILAERSLFWTKQGYIGLGSCHMRTGDEVVVFAGDTTPFLLRKEESGGDEKREGVYKIVSDCYLYGWMYGTFPDQKVKKDPSRRRSLVKKIKGGAKQEKGPDVVLKTFVIT